MGLLTALQKSFAYRLKPTQMVGWMDRVSQAFDAPMVPFAMAQVHFAGGVPSITILSTRIPGLVAGDFTITDNGDGDTTVAWPSGTFPVGGVDPQAITVHSNGGGAAANSIRGNNFARVTTVTFPAALPADADFVLHIYGGD